MTTLLLAAYLLAVPPSTNGFALKSALPVLSDRTTQVFKYPASAGLEFCFYIVGEGAPSPVEFRNGSLLLNRDDFAGPEEGYMDTDATGYHFQRLPDEKTGIVYRVYRMVNPTDAAIELTVVTRRKL